MGIVGNLAPQQRESFDSQGFIVMESFASTEEIEAMRKEWTNCFRALTPPPPLLFSPPKIRSFSVSWSNSLHEIDLVFKEFSCSEKVSNYFDALLLSLQMKCNLLYLLQTEHTLPFLLIDEDLNAVQPGIGGEVTPHQDNSFLYTEPKTCTDGLVRRFIRGEDGVFFDRPSQSYDQKDFVPIEVKAGSLS
ncbi:phytanoyl-CoA dioxygenase-like [Hibiscus syriacus]|uniref:phytanoyl-CoA dioxygenase-like n=1 Tax=Hibiscus syriacus TaxID=106335 RepID=UPI00192382A8|nr:phytanoyl-CoA dioxygenase-like [Hibiscus syriacus]